MPKLLIVDDSALMRRHLKEVFKTERDMEIEFARNGKEAVALNSEFEPDVITLDINMPDMDGLTALSLMMEIRPVPVIMFSSITEANALATLEALAMGAVDYVTKPGGTISLSIEQTREELLSKVRAVLGARTRIRTQRAAATSERRTRPRSAAPTTKNQISSAPSLKSADTSASSNAADTHTTDYDGLVVVGVSTGGPAAIEFLLTHLPAHFPYPILIAQHMPESFTGPFTRRVNQLSALRVVEADRPMRIERQHVYIGRGGTDMVCIERDGALYVRPRPESSQHHWHPSVELLANSVNDVCDASHVIAVMLTGMGNDGAAAFAKLHANGAKVIAESEQTAIVYGMPREVVERNAATAVLPLEEIPNQLKHWALAPTQARSSVWA